MSGFGHGILITRIAPDWRLGFRPILVTQQRNFTRMSGFLTARQIEAVALEPTVGSLLRSPRSPGYSLSNRPG